MKGKLIITAAIVILASLSWHLYALPDDFEKFKDLDYNSQFSFYINRYKNAYGSTDIFQYAGELAQNGEKILKPVLDEISAIDFTGENIHTEAIILDSLVILLDLLMEYVQITQSESNSIVELLEEKCLLYLSITKNIDFLISRCNDFMDLQNGNGPRQISWIEYDRILYEKYKKLGIEGIQYPE